MPLHVERHVTGPFQENTYILRCSATRSFAVVDPGIGVDVRVRELLETEGEHLERILLTHAHLDHIWGLGSVHALASAAPIVMHRLEIPLYRSFGRQALQFGVAGMAPEPPPLVESDSIWHWVAEGDTVTVGDTELFVFEAPGHSPGSVCFYWGDTSLRLAPEPAGPDGLAALAADDSTAKGRCLVGDVVICGSVGRTDLPGANVAHLMRSLRHRIAALPPSTELLGGHCDPSWLSHELTANPYLRDAASLR